MKLQPIFSGEPNPRRNWGIIFYVCTYFFSPKPPPSPSDESLVSGGVLRLRSHSTFQAKSEAGHVAQWEKPLDGTGGTVFCSWQAVGIGLDVFLRILLYFFILFTLQEKWLWFFSWVDYIFMYVYIYIYHNDNIYIYIDIFWDPNNSRCQGARAWE